MRIDALELFHVSMPLVAPWRTAYGEDAAVESVLVRIESQGMSAWAESCPLAAPCYSSEWAAGAFACLRDWLAPAVVGQSISSGEDVAQRLAHFKGNPFAKAALDNAWWVLEAQVRGQPLHRLLGATRDAVDVGADFGVADSLDELVASVGRAFDGGFPRVKLKIRRGSDVDVLRGPAVVSHPAHPRRLQCRLHAGRPELLLPARRLLPGNDRAAAGTRRPVGSRRIATGNPHTDLPRRKHQLREAALEAIELGSCRFVNIKPGRVGGLTPAVAIHDRCREEGIPCWVGGMLESAVGSRIGLALAMLKNFTYPADLFASSRFYVRDLARPPLELATGPGGKMQMRALDAPGIGAEPDAEMLEQCCLSRAMIRPSQGAKRT